MPTESVENGLLLFRTLINFSNLYTPSIFDETSQPSFFQIKKLIAEKIEFIKKTYFNFKNKNEVIFFKSFKKSTYGLPSTQAFELTFYKYEFQKGPDNLSFVRRSWDSFEDKTQIRCGTKLLLFYPFSKISILLITLTSKRVIALNKNFPSSYRGFLRLRLSQHGKFKKILRWA